MSRKSNIAACVASVAMLGASAVASAADYIMTEQDFDRIHTAMDTNKDGIVSRDEYVAYYNRRFDSWDTTRKGSLTRDQIKTRMFERELRKTDGNPAGNSPLPGSVQK
jgi:hypothetical protein